MQYIMILRLALGLAKQVQQDLGATVPGNEKFGVVLNLLTDAVGAADVSKYKDSIQSVVTMCVEAWKLIEAFGFKKSTPAA